MLHSHATIAEHMISSKTRKRSRNGNVRQNQSITQVVPHILKFHLGAI
jgi:hypothetical protein